METLNISGRKNYISPQIECIKLDNCISLALESIPPSGPDEVFNSAPSYFNTDPFKTT